MAAITPIKYAETSTGGVRNPMRDFVSNLPNIYNQYLTILDRNRQRELQDAQFAESKRQFEEAQALKQQEFEAQNLQNLAANTLRQQQLQALIQANEDTKQYRQDTLDYTRGEPGRRINERVIDFYLKSFGNPFGVPLGSSSSSSSGGSGGYKRDPGLDSRIQKEIDYYYSLAKDIDSLSSYIAKLKNTSNDSEFNEWFASMPEEQQSRFLGFFALSGKRLGEKIDYAKLADSLSKQLDNKHSQAQSVYENMASYIDNINEALGGPVYNKPENLFPEKHPDAIRAEKEKRQLEQDKINAENKKRREEAEELREMIEKTAFESNDTSSGSPAGKSGIPFKPRNRAYSYSYDNTLGDKGTTPIFPNPVNMTANYPQGLQSKGTSPISLGIGNPGDPYFSLGNNVYDPYFSSGNNVYEQYLRTLKTGKIR
jgi:hypothetical protein